jgi:hypothetical protein
LIYSVCIVKTERGSIRLRFKGEKVKKKKEGEGIEGKLHD